MAREITVTLKADMRSFDEATDKAKRKLEGVSTEAGKTRREVGNALNAGSESMRRFARENDNALAGLRSIRTAVLEVQGALAALAALNTFKSLAQQSIQAAIAIDKQVSSLRALTGSAEAAQKRFQELFKIAQQTPGLTTSLATTLDTQLRIFNVSERTINRILPVVGRLNAISPLDDPRQLVNNLTQLITQKFDQQDLKELLRQSPIAAQLVAQIFNVDNPTNAEAIRKSAQKLGITTVARLAEELIKAAENSSALKNATETIGGQFDKLQDRITVALAPIGEQIAKVITPAAMDLVAQLERSGPVIANIIRNNAIEMQAFGLAITSTVDAASKLVSEFNGLDKKSGVVRNLLLLLTGVANPTQINSLQSIFNLIDSQRVFPAGSSAPTIVNSKGQILDVKGRVTGQAPPSGADRGTGLGAAASAARRARDPRLFPTLTNDDLVTSQFEGMGDPAALLKFAPGLTSRLRQDISRAIESETGARRSAAEANSRAIDDFQRNARRDLTRSGRFIDDAFNRGQLTPEQAEALSLGANREFANNLRDVLARREALNDATKETLDGLRDEIELYDRLGAAISDSERFMRGFNAATISVGDAFDRFGQNVSRALTNTRDLLNGLKQSVLGFFNDLLGRSLQNLVGQALAPLAALFGGGGKTGNLFRTPNFNPAAAGGQNLFGIGFGNGFGIEVPGSVSQGASGNIGFGQIRLDDPSFGQIIKPGGVAAPSFSFSNFTKSVGAAAPFLGLSVGGGLGGQSVLGQIAGSAGGFLGGGLAGSLLGGITGKAAAFFTNPFTIAIGAGLLVGSIFLGKAKQRRQDEELSGQYLTQALQAIDQLALGVQSGQIDGNQAKQIFATSVLGTFKQQISSLKTKSVVESRLTNQVRDLQNVFNSRIPPLIAEQERKAADAKRFSAIDRRLVPEFARGGVVGGIDRGFDSVGALLRPGEMVLTRAQQSAIATRAGSDIFRSAGVPGVQHSARFAEGGIVSSSGRQADGDIVIEELTIGILMGTESAERVFIAGGMTESGRRVIVNQIRNSRKHREM